MAKNVGLFNPLTLSGTIIVNGAVASVHSEWFLDSAFDTIGGPDLLPAAYQVSYWLRCPSDRIWLLRLNAGSSI